MAYAVPNADLDALYGALDGVDASGGELEEADIGVIGGTLYGHVVKDAFPDASVTVAESNPAAAVTQAYAADLLERGKSPREVRDRLYLSPFVDEVPEGWSVSPGGESVRIPEDDYERFRDDLDDFLARSTHFEADDAEAVYARRNMPVRGDNMFGVNDIGTDDGEVSIDLYTLTHQRDIYPHVLDEIDRRAGVRSPDTLHVGEAGEMDPGNGFDVLLTNNVVDWFDTPGQFFGSMDALGKDNGYHLELYTMPRSTASERVTDPAEIARMVPADPSQVDVTGHARVGTLHSMGDYLSTFDGTYDTDPIQGEENGFIVHVDRAT